MKCTWASELDKLHIITFRTWIATKLVATLNKYFSPKFLLLDSGAQIVSFVSSWQIDNNILVYNFNLLCDLL